MTVVQIDLERLRALVEARPDATVRELHERLGVDCNESAVGMTLKRPGMTFKKSRPVRRSRIDPMSPDVAPTGRKVSPTLTRNA